MRPIVSNETSRVRLIEYSRYRDSTVSAYERNLFCAQEDEYSTNTRNARNNKGGIYEIIYMYICVYMYICIYEYEIKERKIHKLTFSCLFRATTSNQELSKNELSENKFSEIWLMLSHVYCNLCGGLETD